MAEELLGQKRSVASKRHTEDDMAAKDKQTEQVKQISTRVTELEGEAVRGNETVANLEVKLKAAKKRDEDSA